MTTKFLPILPLLLALNVSAAEIPAQGASNVDQTTVTSGERPKSRWTMEGSVQAHSVAAEASPWIGLSGLYRVGEYTNIGLRGFLPVAKSVDSSTYEIQALARFRVYHGDNTDLFLEPDFAANFYKWLPFTSYGLSVGALNRLSADLSVGILGGLEVTHVVMDSFGLEQRNGFIIYPKIALLADFNF